MESFDYVVLYGFCGNKHEDAQDNQIEVFFLCFYRNMKITIF